MTQKISYLSIALIFLLPIQTFSQKPTVTQDKLELTKPSGEPMATLMNINDISMWVRADGWSERNPITGESGIIFPRGTAGAVFQDGIIWGG